MKLLTLNMWCIKNMTIWKCRSIPKMKLKSKVLLMKYDMPALSATIDSDINDFARRYKHSCTYI